MALERGFHRFSILWIGVGVLCLCGAAFNASWRMNLVALGLLCFIAAGVWGRR